MKKHVWTLFLIVGAISMIAMSTHYLQHSQSGILTNRPAAAHLWHLILFRTHVAGGLMAISIGPFQFINRLRVRHRKWHRLLGYLYVVSVMTSGLGGLVVAQFSLGGWMTTSGFSLLALTWMATTLHAVKLAQAGLFVTHGRWFTYSYALTFSAITQRTLLLVPLLTSTPFLPIYRLSAWFPWLFNFLVAWLWTRKATHDPVL